MGLIGEIGSKGLIVSERAFCVFRHLYFYSRIPSTAPGRLCENAAADVSEKNTVVSNMRTTSVNC
jgi:hypothetical protein